MRRIFLYLIFIALACGQTANTDKFNHAQWTATTDASDVAPGSTILVKLNAQVDPEWHLYSLTKTPGPNPTVIKLESPAVQQVTYLQPPPIKKYDENFKADTETYEGAVTFLAKIQIKPNLPDGPATLVFEPRYQTCSGTSCIPPKTRRVELPLTVKAGPALAAVIPAGFAEIQNKANSASGTADPTDLPGFLLLAFTFGLAAIFTPCVFPMIPITMSYFVGQQRGGFTQAVVFCLGIIVLFTSLGLATTIFLGPAGVAVLGSNPWVNGFIAAVFFIFGLSLLGAFEITIPSALLTKLNDASGKGGFAGTLLMGLTFALASFACVGPFMGTLLAASVTGGKLRPVLGMIVFATGLSLPFFFLALFPKYLQKLPRSGEWLSASKL